MVPLSQDEDFIYPNTYRLCLFLEIYIFKNIKILCLRYQKRTKN